MSAAHPVGKPFSATTYNYWNCRCEGCRAANFAKYRAWRDRAAAEVASGERAVEHGKTSTYSNYACRCALCKAAWAAGGYGRARTLESYRVAAGLQEGPEQ